MTGMTGKIMRYPPKMCRHAVINEKNMIQIDDSYFFVIYKINI